MVLKSQPAHTHCLCRLMHSDWEGINLVALLIWNMAFYEALIIDLEFFPDLLQSLLLTLCFFNDENN